MTPELPEVHLRREVPRHVVEKQQRIGDWVSLRRGALTDAPTGKAWEQRLQLALAAAVASQRQLIGSVLVLESAALAHGLRHWQIPDVTSVNQRVKPRAGLPRDIRRHTFALADDDIVCVRTLLATSLHRTMVDCACTYHPRDALVIVDSGMEKIVAPRRDEPREDIEARTAALRADLLARVQPGQRGAVQGRAIITAANALAESAPESVIRWVVLSRGMPTPQLQRPVSTARGTFYTDLAWRFAIDGKPLWYHIEFDGTDKYRNDPQRRDITEVLLRERKREAAITDTGDKVRRIYSDDVGDEDRVFRKITAPISSAVVAGYRKDPVLYRPPGCR